MARGATARASRRRRTRRRSSRRTPRRRSPAPPGTRPAARELHPPVEHARRVDERVPVHAPEAEDLRLLEARDRPEDASLLRPGHSRLEARRGCTPSPPRPPGAAARRRTGAAPSAGRSAPRASSARRRASSRRATPSPRWAGTPRSSARPRTRAARPSARAERRRPRRPGTAASSNGQFTYASSPLPVPSSGRRRARPPCRSATA